MPPRGVLINLNDSDKFMSRDDSAIELSWIDGEEDGNVGKLTTCTALGVITTGSLLLVPLTCVLSFVSWMLLPKDETWKELLFTDASASSLASSLHIKFLMPFRPTAILGGRVTFHSVPR
eukprot:CCRYP_006749-RA/>CCRYP_006749-RA protein AED:0.38 eAED:0.61 QI:552/0/0.5/1/0/0/2/0/119